MEKKQGFFSILKAMVALVVVLPAMVALVVVLRCLPRWWCSDGCGGGCDGCGGGCDGCGGGCGGGAAIRFINGALRFINNNGGSTTPATRRQIRERKTHRNRNLREHLLFPSPSISSVPPLSFSCVGFVRRAKKVSSKLVATKKVVLRTIKLFLLGLILQGGYFHGRDDLTYGVDINHIRWMGVLQRISIGYLLASLTEIWCVNHDEVNSAVAFGKKYYIQ